MLIPHLRTLKITSFKSKTFHPNLSALWTKVGTYLNFKSMLTINSCQLRSLVSAMFGFGVTNIPGVSLKPQQEVQAGFLSEVKKLFWDIHLFLSPPKQSFDPIP